MGLIKDVYSQDFFDRLSDVLSATVPDFDKSRFLSDIFTDNFKDLEYKERMKHTTAALKQQFPENYEKSVAAIENLIVNLRKTGFKNGGIEFMFLPDFVETYGLDYFEVSVKSFEFITQFISCEFAVRPFIIKYGDKMIIEMVQWSLHPAYPVRRLASEGSRPRLPWAMAIPFLKKDPTPILPILENLKDDPVEWVRRSVANNINDIAKDNPEVVLELAKKWKGLSKETDAIIKHGSRTLLKKGHPEILSYFGLNSTGIKLSNFEILTPVVRTGESLQFSFHIINENEVAQVLRLEYGVYYLKQNGQLVKKVFKISERLFQPNETVKVTRKQSFKIITTRVFYPGKHELSIIINGEEKEKKVFELIT